MFGRFAGCGALEREIDPIVARALIAAKPDRRGKVVDGGRPS
jgi:hypothetical protein